MCISVFFKTIKKRRMKSTLFSNLLQRNRLQIKPANNNFNRLTSGFTLIEVLVVIVMVGILSAIAAPSWLGFVARQRLNKSNDAVLAALREAQREARNRKLSYSVSFRTENNIPEVAIHRHDLDSQYWRWRSLGREAGVDTDKFLLGTNIEGSNTKKSEKPIYGTGFDKNKPQSITFNHIGILDLKQDNSSADTGLKVSLAIPKPNKPTEKSNVKRCVIVETLIGGIRTAKNDDCD